ncbi:MAG TPA: alanine--glyoxylate aminotransferase family protein [Thermomicrobiales bacterium]
MGRNFRLPGPTPLPPAVVEAMQREMIPHRGSAFRDLYRSILARAKEVHRTDGDVLLFPASGSAGWEVAISNLLAPGDAVLATIVGDFGERFARVASAFGLDVRRLERPWGSAITPDLLRAALNEHPDVKAVLLTHNETSTGITNPLPELAAIVREHGALVLVDAVSSAGGLPLLVDEWGLDFVLSGSQKAWMCPPGLLIVAVGPRAWEAAERGGFPRFFWDLRAAREAAANGMTPTTPPLSLLYAFDAALDLILSEGLEQVWRRHAELGERTRQGVRSLGLRLYGDEAYASNTVTAVAVPPGASAKEIVARMEKEHGVTVASGQAHAADAMVRIGHMGWVTAEDIDDCLNALGAVVRSLESAAIARA